MEKCTEHHHLTTTTILPVSQTAPVYRLLQLQVLLLLHVPRPLAVHTVQGAGSGEFGAQQESEERNLVSKEAIDKQ
jgi:hypothetical protein